MKPILKYFAFLFATVMGSGGYVQCVGAAEYPSDPGKLSKQVVCNCHVELVCVMCHACHELSPSLSI